MLSKKLLNLSLMLICISIWIATDKSYSEIENYPNWDWDTSSDNIIVFNSIVDEVRRNEETGDINNIFIGREYNGNARIFLTINPGGGVTEKIPKYVKKGQRYSFLVEFNRFHSGFGEATSFDNTGTPIDRFAHYNIDATFRGIIENDIDFSKEKYEVLIINMVVESLDKENGRYSAVSHALGKPDSRKVRFRVDGNLDELPFDIIENKRFNFNIKVSYISHNGSSLWPLSPTAADPNEIEFRSINNVHIKQTDDKVVYINGIVDNIDKGNSGNNFNISGISFEREIQNIGTFTGKDLLRININSTYKYPEISEGNRYTFKLNISDISFQNGFGQQVKWIYDINTNLLEVLDENVLSEDESSNKDIFIVTIPAPINVNNEGQDNKFSIRTDSLLEGDKRFYFIVNGDQRLVSEGISGNENNISFTFKVNLSEIKRDNNDSDFYLHTEHLLD